MSEPSSSDSKSDIEFGLVNSKNTIESTRKDDLNIEDIVISTDLSKKKPSTSNKSASSTTKISFDKNYGRSGKGAIVSAGKSGSQAHLIRNEDGSISSVRRGSMSAADVRVAVNRKLSANSSQINIFTPAVAGKEVDPNPFFTAADAIERLEGKGDFHEHLWPLESLSENYHCHLNLTHIKESQGLSEERAKQLIDEYGVSYLKY